MPRVCLWWIHFDIWQNQYNIVKFKNKIKLKKYILGQRKKKEEIKGIRTGKEVKLSLHADDIILHLKTLKTPPKNY